MDTIGASSIEVQNNETGKWKTVGIIPGCVYNKLMTNDEKAHLGSFFYINATPGIAYRAIIHCHAERDGKIETVPYKTSAIIAK